MKEGVPPGQRKGITCIHHGLHKQSIGSNELLLWKRLQVSKGSWLLIMMRHLHDVLAEGNESKYRYLAIGPVDGLH